MPENSTPQTSCYPSTSTQMDTIKSSLTAVALKKRGYTAEDLSAALSNTWNWARAISHLTLCCG